MWIIYILHTNMHWVRNKANTVYRLSIRPKNCNDFLSFRLCLFSPGKTLKEYQITHLVVKLHIYYGIALKDEFYRLNFFCKKNLHLVSIWKFFNLWPNYNFINESDGAICISLQSITSVLRIRILVDPNNIAI